MYLNWSNNFTFQICRVISILIHYFFTSCFMFMFLESIHMYSLVAFVVHKDGLMTRLQVKSAYPDYFYYIFYIYMTHSNILIHLSHNSKYLEHDGWMGSSCSVCQYVRCFSIPRIWRGGKLLYFILSTSELNVGNYLQIENKINMICYE